MIRKVTLNPKCEIICKVSKRVEMNSRFCRIARQKSADCRRDFWLSTPTGDIRAISGWFILQTGIGEFVVFSILTTEKDFAYAESAIDTAVVTIDIRDMSAVQKERADRLQAGADF